MPGEQIIDKAKAIGLDLGLLYEAVIDLSTEGLLTARSINQAAGILLNDLGLPKHFFATISKAALRKLLKAIALSIKVDDGIIELHGRVAPVEFDQDKEPGSQRVRIATAETRDAMERVLETQISGHQREYFYSPKNGYATYIIRPETVADFTEEDFKESRFLFNLIGDRAATSETTRQRHEQFLVRNADQALQLIEFYNLPETGETRIMFNSDFERPQLPILRKLLADFGLTIVRASWEPYLGKDAVPSSVCSIYVLGELTRLRENEVKTALRSFLGCPAKTIDDHYLQGTLTFEELLFASNAIDFCLLFIYQESENHSDRELLEALSTEDQRETFSKRIQSSNRSIYTQALLDEAAYNNPDLLKMLYALFADKFDPKVNQRLSEAQVQLKEQEFMRLIAARFLDAPLNYDIFHFMFRLITSTRKTNFYKAEKRSFAFRFDSDVLDPLVYRQFVHGVFFTSGHYSCGTHLRAADISRGGLRMLRVNRANYQSILANAVLLNYALGPVAQRLKHKDICESGAKGVVIPHPQYARYTLEALIDYTEGILDLMQPDPQIVDYLGTPELIFFGPDEGTAPFMDAVAENARKRGYRHWRTITTGKTIGIPHDAFGLLDSGEAFGLFDMDKEGVELQIEGKRELLTNDLQVIYDRIGEKISTSGLTTTGLMSVFRTLIKHAGAKEEELNLMMTGGPDGDLGANSILCYTGKICLIVDGGSVLFDPDGLDRVALRKIALQRNSKPRANTTAFPLDKLGKNGFMVTIGSKNLTLPDGRLIEDGTLFHRTFLTDPANRALIEQANIQAFIPCGGFKDTINRDNVAQFAKLFQELRFIVEGANVFFDDAARRYLAQNTKVMQIKDFSVNKGGVFSSSVGEVLTAFLLQERYEEVLIDDIEARWGLVRNIMDMLEEFTRLETTLLLSWHEQDKSQPLFELSKRSSEQVFAFQDQLAERLPEILADKALVDRVLQLYVPAILHEKIGPDFIRATLDTPELSAYRDAIITKKIASMAFYRHGLEWDKFLQRAKKDLIKAVSAALQ
ncbi:MAG: NADP-specific glutamate dehydrogenase GdhA [Desulfobulbaceae bacterium]|nr:NADP-specific glutamate dehydrogenase GdhA [Desulfobulbaceae bacterium]